MAGEATVVMRELQRTATLQSALLHGIELGDQFRPVQLEERQPTEEQPGYGVSPVWIGALEVDIQQQLAVELIQRRGFQRTDQASVHQLAYQSTRFGRIQPVAEIRHGLICLRGQAFAGEQQMQSIIMRGLFCIPAVPVASKLPPT